MRESIITGAITIAIGLAVIAATGWMQRLDNLERELAEQKREAVKAEALMEYLKKDAAHLIMHSGLPTICLDGPLDSWATLEMLKKELLEAGTPVTFHRGTQ